MAERPVFLPSSPTTPHLVEERSFTFEWHSGFSAIQKKKNVAALHRAAARSGCDPLLEVSTKSENELGRRLSAFHLKVESTSFGKIPLECAFQGSKVFERGGPYTDLYGVDARDSEARCTHSHVPGDSFGLIMREQFLNANRRLRFMIGCILTPFFRTANGLSAYSTTGDSQTLNSIRHGP